MKEVADAAVAGAPSVERVLVVRRARRPTEGVPWTAGRDVWWEEVVPAQAPACPAVDTDASEPYMIIYTSGTTGRPKGPARPRWLPLKVRGGPVPLLRRAARDRVLWYSDVGWMMAPG